MTPTRHYMQHQVVALKPRQYAPDSWVERQSMRPGFQFATQSIVVLLSLGFWFLVLWGVYRVWWQ